MHVFVLSLIPFIAKVVEEKEHGNDRKGRDENRHAERGGWRKRGRGSERFEERKMNNESGKSGKKREEGTETVLRRGTKARLVGNKDKAGGGGSGRRR